MSPALLSLLLDRPAFNPYRLPNNEAIYSLDGPESDATYLTNGSGRVTLVADRSGNSSQNAWVSGAGGTSNNLSTPSSTALQLVDALEIVARVSFATYAAGSAQFIVAKDSGSSGEFVFRIETNGALTFYHFVSGTEKDFSVSSPSWIDGTTYWLRVTRTFAGGNATVKIYRTADTGNNTVPSSWTQIGSDQVVASAAPTATTNAVQLARNLGSNGGILFYLEIRNAIGGSAVAKADPSAQAKLTGSWASTSGETWTVNASGDVGARVCGARDLYQGTTSKMPGLSTIGGYNTLTFDGSNDFIKAAMFNLPQPISRYSGFALKTWTIDRHILDGLTSDSCELQNYVSTPRILSYAGTSDPNLINSNLVVGSGNRSIVTEVYNGASSLTAVNRTTPTTGNAGTSAANGLTIGSQADGSNSSNIEWCDTILRSVADDVGTQARIVRFLASKWGIST